MSETEVLAPAENAADEKLGKPSEQTFKVVGDTTLLDGYGTRKGMVLEAKVVKKTRNFVVVTAKNGKGEPVDLKFQLADGMVAGATGNSGYRLRVDEFRKVAAKKAPKVKAEKPVKEKVVREKKAAANPSGICFCGCGGATKNGSRFIPGHDAIAHSRVKKFLRGQLSEEDLAKASDYIREEVEHQGGWNTQEDPKVAARQLKAQQQQQLMDELQGTPTPEDAGSEEGTPDGSGQPQEGTPEAQEQGSEGQDGTQAEGSGEGW